tara:strand:- start:31 stop:699 length:669 start_codon:yes stop_codon:yes gene_type:complete
MVLNSTTINGTFKFAWSNLDIISLSLNVNSTIKEIYNQVINHINHSINLKLNEVYNNSRYSKLSINDIEIIYVDKTENGHPLENYINHNSSNILSTEWRSYINNSDRNYNRWKYVNNIFISDYFDLNNYHQNTLSFYIRIFDNNLINNLTALLVHSEVNNCGVCMESISDTSVFTCSHTFCRSCITTWINICNSQSQLPSCPLCRNSTLNTRNLTTNYVVPI